jgi:long-chain acyl-CoA synthetase
MNTADVLLEHGRAADPALITESETLTYGDLRQASARILAELLAVGARPCGRVGLLAGNTPFWVAAYLAILKLGAAAVPCAPAATSEDLHALLQVTRCELLCAERRLWGRFAGALPSGLCVLTEGILAQPGARDWPASAGCDIDDDAVLMSTSGTTARPRVVRITHRNIQANTDSILTCLGLNGAERMLVVLPLTYCFSDSLLHTHLKAGATLVLARTFAYPELVLDLMEARACTGLAGVPSTFLMLLRNSTFPRRRLQTLRQMQQAGGRLPDGVIRELMAARPGTDLYVMYGQTEATARLSYLPPNRLADKLGSVGRGIPGVTLQVLDDEGRTVRSGQVGEINAWGENISPGYYGDPAASAEKFVDGALRTGDLATLDDDGFIYITDRKSDFIKSYGHRVGSQQVQDCALALPDLIAAAAVGVPDPVRGEAIVLFVVLSPGSSLTSVDIMAQCAHHLAHYMVPARVVVVDRLPVNENGKVVKAELRHLAAQ